MPACTGTRSPTGPPTGAARCLHNELYWRSADWWGFGPGAHSHVGGVRWWNVKHPSAYAAKLAAGESPAAARELLGAEDRRVERVLLETRLVDGLDPAELTPTGARRLRTLSPTACSSRTRNGWC